MTIMDAILEAAQSRPPVSSPPPEYRAARRQTAEKRRPPAPAIPDDPADDLDRFEASE